MPATIDWDAVDGAYRSKLEAASDLRRWLLTQTLATATPRRALLAALGPGPGWRFLDVGCGFGASAVEMACMGPVSAVGVDTDGEVLTVASDVGAELTAAGVLAAGSSISFVSGDAYHLPCRAGNVDAVTCRFVFQHLARPTQAAAELARVVRAGGVACLVDVDDGLSLSEPAPSEAFSRLAGALRDSQASGGGDRYVGRKLAGLLDQAGFEPANVVVLPQAGYRRSAPGDPARTLLVERFRVARDAIIACGALEPDEFDALLASFADEQPGAVCEIEGQVAVLARRRP